MITAWYGALFGLLFVGLSVRTLLLRRRFQVAVGDGAQVALQRAARVHGNFAEYVPLALLLVYFAESLHGAAATAHVLCITLLLGRVLHAYGVSQVAERYGFRVAGMICTLGPLVYSCVYLLRQGLPGT